MNIPRYWARVSVDEDGRPDPSGGVTSFGWSDDSEAAAERMAADRAERAAAAAHDGPRGAYPYPDRPVRETLLERNDGAGWALTRNSYGAVILNTARVMFIDVDAPPVPPRGCLGLFGGSGPAPDASALIARVREVTESLGDLGLRVYRTAAGLRVLVTSETYDPTSDLARDLMNAFGADPRYAQLCRMQESFRARLTPKPWRMAGLQPPPARYPFRDAAESAAFDAWLERYERARPDYAVCELLETLGPPAITDAARPVVHQHDEYVLNEGRGLA